MPDVFSGDNQSPPSDASAFEQLVGAGKKFSDPESLAKGKLASDTHIQNLEGQLAEMRKDLDARLTAEEQITRLLSEQNQNSQERPNGGETTPSLSREELAELVRNTVQDTNSETQATANLQKANDRLVELYGENASGKLKAKAAELQLSVDFLKDVARKSPSAFFNTIGVEASSVKAPIVNQGSVNSQALSDQQQGQAPSAGTWRYYEKLRKDNSRDYWKPAIQSQMFKDAQEKGDAFYT